MAAQGSQWNKLLQRRLTLRQCQVEPTSIEPEALVGTVKERSLKHGLVNLIDWTKLGSEEQFATRVLRWVI